MWTIEALKENTDTHLTDAKREPSLSPTLPWNIFLLSNYHEIKSLSILRKETKYPIWYWRFSAKIISKIKFHFEKSFYLDYVLEILHHIF